VAETILLVDDDADVVEAHGTAAYVSAIIRAGS